MQTGVEGSYIITIISITQAELHLSILGIHIMSSTCRYHGTRRDILQSLEALHLQLELVVHLCSVQRPHPRAGGYRTRGRPTAPTEVYQAQSRDVVDAGPLLTRTTATMIGKHDDDELSCNSRPPWSVQHYLTFSSVPVASSGSMDTSGPSHSDQCPPAQGPPPCHRRTSLPSWRFSGT